MDSRLGPQSDVLSHSPAGRVKPRVSSSVWLMRTVTEDSLLLGRVLIFSQNEFASYSAQLPRPFNGPAIE